MTDLDAIRKRLTDCPIPEDAQADWRGTDHYEIQSASNVDAGVGIDVIDDGWWWLDVFDTPRDSLSVSGRRLGAVLDYACAYRRDVKALIEEIERLRGVQLSP